MKARTKLAIRQYATLDPQYEAALSDLNMELAELGVNRDDVEIPMGVLFDRLIEVAYEFGKISKGEREVAAHG